MKQDCVEVTTCKARIKYVALLNVLFYKWLSYPAGISGWHCAAVTTTISATHACLSMGALSSKVKCQMLSIPSYREAPGAASGARRTCFELEVEKHHYWAGFCFGARRLSWSLQTHDYTSIYLISKWRKHAPVLSTWLQRRTFNHSSLWTIITPFKACKYSAWLINDA